MAESSQVSRERQSSSSKLPQLLTRRPSNVHGFGVFTEYGAKNGDLLLVEVGKGLNDSSAPNVTTWALAPVRLEGKWYIALVALRDLAPGEECFIEYRRDLRPPAA